MFRVLTPIIRSSYSCNYSFQLQQRERMVVDQVNQYQKLQLQLYELLMMGVNTRNMQSCLQKYNKLNNLHLVGQLLNSIYDARTHVYKILRTFWNPKVRYRIHNSLPLAPVLSQINPVRASPSHLLNCHFNIILPSTTRSSKWCLFLRSPNQNPVCIFPLSVLHAPPISLFLI